MKKTLLLSLAGVLIAFGAVMMNPTTSSSQETSAHGYYNSGQYQFSPYRTRNTRYYRSYPNYTTRRTVNQDHFCGYSGQYCTSSRHRTGHNTYAYRYSYPRNTYYSRYSRFRRGHQFPSSHYIGSSFRYAY